jgi:6-phosphogluconolactonase
VTEREAVLLVGSYTDNRAAAHGVGEGVTALALDGETGALRVLDRLGELPNPAYLRWHGRDLVHVALENPDASSGLAAIEIDTRGALSLVNRIAIEGHLACHLDVHPSGSWLASACYASGHVVRAGVDARGAVCAPGLVNRQSGSSTHPVRQTSSHPHAACFSADGGFLLVPDLGTDEVWIYPAQGEPRRWRAQTGSGPRLILFSRDQRHLILVHELASAVSSLRWQAGAIGRVQTLSALPPGFAAANTTAGLRWHPGGELFAVSNRGENTIVLLRFAAATGAIEIAARIPSGGAKPRDFDFSPCGRWLVVGNQDSDNLAVFRVDATAGALTDSGQRLALGTPACVRFRPPG